jgi:hypothetical protein
VIKLTFEFASADAAIEALLKIRAPSAPFPWASQQEFIEAAAPAPTEVAAVPEPAPAAAPSPAPALTKEELRAALADLGQKGKRSAVQGLLKTFGVDKLGDLHPSQYADLLAAAKEL